MNKIFSSASKIVLLYIVLILGILALFSGVWSVIHNDLNETTKLIFGLFASCVTFVMGFYFNSKGDPDEPYAGK